MRFEMERKDPENKGFEKALALVEKVHQKYPKITRADLHVLVGYVAFEVTGGPFIPFKTGRRDFSLEEAKENGFPFFGDGKFNPHGSRLPAADCGTCPLAKKDGSIADLEAPTIKAVRSTFERMGFNDRETVALIVLGHQYGRCHPEVSGNEDPWYAFGPTHWNAYLHGMGYLSVYTMGEHKFRPRVTKKGKRQYSMNLGGGRFMMLISDMALLWDKAYKGVVEI